MTPAPIAVTRHAAIRYRQRIDPSVTLDEAHAALLAYSRAVQAAARIGCRVVRLGCGARLILAGTTIVTVFPRDRYALPRALWEGPSW